MVWNIMNPLFSNKGRNKDNIVLVTGDKNISEYTEVAQTFNDFLKNSVKSLNILENKLLLTETETIHKGAEKAIKRFEIHASIISIHENVKIDSVSTNDAKSYVNQSLPYGTMTYAKSYVNQSLAYGTMTYAKSYVNQSLT